MAKSTGGGIALAVLVLLIAAGAGGGGTSGDGTDVHPSADGSEDTHAEKRDHSTERVEKRLEADGLEVTRLEDDTSENCAAHSYGEVHEHFREHPCEGLHRALYEVRDGEDEAVVAVGWVDMPDEAEAREYQRLVDRHGTGNVTELTKDGVGPTSTHWTGRRYDSVRDGVTVVNVQAEPVGGSEGASRLAERAGTTAIG